jgi:predicted alpha/beta superfamily hydrolase
MRSTYRGSSSTILILFLFFIITSVLLHSQEQDLPRVEIPGTQLRHITSAIVNQEYDVYISLPRNYEDTSKTFPVVYVMDAQWDFTLVTSLFGQQYFDGFVPGLIIVGVTWGGNHPNPDSLRVRDYTPAKTAQAVQSGGSEKFLSFMKKELIPFIDSTYRTKKEDRTFMGSSLGGLVTLYTLFTSSDMFNRFILTSPAIGWADGVINQFEKNFVEHDPETKLRIFIAEGGLEPGVSDFTSFVDHLKKQHISNLSIGSKIIEGVGHSGGKAEGYTRGLQFVFARHSIHLSPKILDQYAGVYQLGPGINVLLTRGDNGLIAKLPDGSQIHLEAESEKDFYVPGIYFFCHFITESQGKIAGATIEQFTGERYLQKIESH